MRTRLELRYEGPAVDAGAMDVYQASTNMVAFSDFMVTVAKVAYGPDVKLQAQVAGHAAGSFETELLFNIVGPAASVLSNVAPGDLLRLVKEALALWKALRGESPAKIEHRDNRNVSVTNNNGEVFVVNIDTLSVVLNPQAGEAVRAFVNEPLARGGIDRVQIGEPGKRARPLAEVEQDEGSYYRPIIRSQPLGDVMHRIGLNIESPSFKDGNKWRFSDGQISFHADILDPDFLARVDAGEPFAKGDLLIVDLHISQEIAGSKVSTVRAVVKVHDHRGRSEQNNLFAPPD